MSNYTQSAGQFIGQHHDKRKRKPIPPQIHILDHKTDQIVHTIDNKNDKLFWGDKHEYGIDNKDIFDFITLYNNSEYLTSRYRVVIPSEEGDFFHEFIIDENKKDKGNKEVHTSASFIDLKKMKYIEPDTLTDYTAEMATDYAVTDTEWQRGVTESNSTQTVSIEDYTNPYDLLKAIASKFDLELRFRVVIRDHRIIGRYVDLLQKRGSWRGKEVVLGKDLIGVRRTEKSDNVVSALLVVGPEPEDGSNPTTAIVEDEDARQRWTRTGDHLWDVHVPETEESELSVDQLTTIGRTELNKRINAIVNYESDAVSLEHIFGLDHEKTRIGDTVRVKDTSYQPALYLEARVINIKRSLSKPSRKTFILGDFIEYTEEKVKSELKILKKKIAHKVSQLTLTDYAEKKKIKSTTAPTDTGVIWIDTSKKPNIAKTYDSDSASWEKFTPTNADEIDESTSRKFASESGADVTGNNTANDTNYVSGSSSTIVRDNASDGKTAKTTVDDNKSTWDRASNINSDGTFDTLKLEGIIDTASNNIQSDSQFYWSGGNLVAIDPNNTNNIVQMSSGGVGVSTDGGSTYKNAITGNGIVASAIDAETLSAITADLGTVTAGDITTDSFIDVGTNLSIGKNIYMGDAYSYDTHYVHFHYDGEPDPLGQPTIYSSYISVTRNDDDTMSSRIDLADDTTFVAYNLTLESQTIDITGDKVNFASGPSFDTTGGDMRVKADSSNYMELNPNKATFWMGGVQAFTINQLTDDNDHIFLDTGARTGLKMLTGASTSTPQIQSRNGDDTEYGVFAGSDFVTASSETLKENIESASETLDKIRGLEVIAFNYKSDDKAKSNPKKIGLSYERTAETMPEITNAPEDGLPGGISNANLIGAMLKALQETNDRIDKLEQK